MTNLPGPVPAEALPVLGDDGRRSDDDQGGKPVSRELSIINIRLGIAVEG